MNTTETHGSPCPEFWTWLPQAYHNGDVGIQAKFTKYNMEVAFLAGKQFAFNQLGIQKQNITENMSALQAAAQQALAALKNNKRVHYYCEDTWYSCPKHEEGCANELEGDECNCGADEVNKVLDAAIADLEAALEQPEPEPVAWMCSDETLVYKGYSRFSRTKDGPWNIPVYTHPPRREWQGLTEDEIWKCWWYYDERAPEGEVDFARAVEARLKELNA
jgi:hypothetical protein